jgi:hypothetical protein
MWPKTDDEEFSGEMMFGYGPETELPKSKPAPEVSPEQRLLDWLQRWPKETVTARDMQQFGPKEMRNQRGMIDAAEVLVRHHWLAPVQSYRRDRREWRIIRVHPTVTTPVVHPTVAL